MSMFFFRLHNLQRAEENKRKKRAEQQRQQQRQRRGAKVFKCVTDSTGHLTLAPSRLFERTPMSPSDSLDEIALQIPSPN
ncbi:GH20109 [Drosophila grimshawi]|uniref:GH20109 n=1 Tax=Drosophila grimshawi TaxID=7222 RepID=B4J6X7_DROGR|nr:GH20109 [Drosophila grimshawi]